MTGPADVRIAEFIDAERKLLARCDLEANRWSVDVDVLGGQVSGLVAGEGPPVLMIVGGGPPMGIWIPVMAELTGFRLYAMDLPGIGLTSPTRLTPDNHRATAVTIIDDLLDALDLDGALLAAQSIGGLWALWFALDRPGRTLALSLLSCPGALLGTSAPLPLRMMTIPGVAPLVQRLDPPSPKQVERFIHTAGERFEDQDELRALFLAVERLPTYHDSLRRTRARHGPAARRPTSHRPDRDRPTRRPSASAAHLGRTGPLRPARGRPAGGRRPPRRRAARRTRGPRLLGRPTLVDRHAHGAVLHPHPRTVRLSGAAVPSLTHALGVNALATHRHRRHTGDPPIPTAA